MKQASKETRERALKAYKNGVSIDKICESFSICRKTFYFWRKREAEGGIQVAKPKCHRPPALSAEDMERIKKLYEQDNSLFIREVAEKLGLTCHPSIIYRAVKKLGFTFKKKLSSQKNKTGKR